MRATSLLLLPLVAALVACSTGAAVVAGHAPPSPALASSPGGVFVLGGIHAAHEGAKTYTYARMGEIFSRLAPDVLCVEVLQRHLDDGSDEGMPFDFKKFLVPAARTAGTPIVGIDWWDESRGAAWERLQNEAAEDPALEPQVRLLGGLFVLLGGYFQATDVREVNSRAVSDLWAAKNELKHEALSRDPKYLPVVDYENERNAHMLDNVLKAVEAQPGRRVLVAVGIDHKPAIERGLRARGVRVLDVDDALREWSR